jgi:hypothetical protein
MELKKSGTFRNRDHKTKHNIIWEDESWRFNDWRLVLLGSRR